MPFTQYIKALGENLRTGQAGEETHRLALQHLLDELGDDIQAINEPTHVPVGDYVAMIENALTTPVLNV